ncbi:MAG: flagellar biosynthetic protein FliR [Roseovarius sp.]
MSGLEDGFGHALAALGELIGLGARVLWLHAVVLLRAGPVMTLFPGFGDQGGVPMRVRLVLALMLSAVTASADPPGLAQLAADPPPLAWLLVSETAVGLLLGIGLRLLLVGLQTAGAMAAQAMSLSQIAGSAGSEPMPAIERLLVVGGLALAMTLGLHVRLAEMLILSYGPLPAGRLPEAAALAEWGVSRVAWAFGFAFSLAAPFVLVSLLYNLALGVINRAMPQLMMVFVGAPVISGAGLVLLLLLAPAMLGRWLEAVAAFVADPLAGAG